MAPQLPPTGGSSAETVSIPVSVGAKTKPVLFRQPSDPDEDEWEVAKRVAGRVSDAFARKRLYSSDRTDAETAEYWVDHVDKRVQKVQEPSKIPEWIPQFLDMVVKLLLDSESLGDVPKFCAHFKSIAEKRAVQNTLLIQTCIAIGTHDLASSDAPNLDFLDEKTKIKERLTASKLYKQFKRERREARFTQAKTSLEMGEDARLKVLVELKDSLADFDVAKQKELQVMITIFGAASHEEKLLYLLEDDKRIDILQAWKPRAGRWADRRAFFKPFAQKSGLFDGMNCDAFMKAATTLMLSTRAIEAVSHPVVKPILIQWAAARKVVAEESPEGERGQVCFLLLTMCSWKCP